MILLDPKITLELLAMAVLLFFSGLFSASETSLMGLGRSRLAKAIEKGGARGRALEVWKNDPNRMLTTILILNNAVNITATTIGLGSTPMLCARLIAKGVTTMATALLLTISVSTEVKV